ncbi:MAG: hypothetical protein AMDU2_EPLC00013G0008 [Thermoplasmatales archaeon E-plasma]|nr:MAG: hypothetical protein AMDU2_EPLC00013G0008 [Thermoplasmatales archaeon E-plasma]
MTIYESEVEVVNVGRVTSAIDGSLIYQVAFGKISKPADGVPIPAGSKEIAASTLIMYFKSEKDAPYKVGTKWNLSVSESGSISLTRKR